MGTNFAHLASFQAIEFVDRPASSENAGRFSMSDKYKQNFLYKTQHSVTVVREEWEQNLISSPASTLSARSA